MNLKNQKKDYLKPHSESHTESTRGFHKLFFSSNFFIFLNLSY